jgi:hypothetical protein
MDLGRALGSTFVARLTDSRRWPLLVIGKDRWSSADVASLGVIQPKACRILSRIAADLDARSTRDLYAKTSPYYLAGLPGVGVTTLYVLLRVFADAGLDVDRWYVKPQADAVRRFQTLKHREHKANQRTRRSRRRASASAAAAVIH